MRASSTFDRQEPRAKPRRYEQKTGIKNKSTYWVVFELLWGDYNR